MTPLYLLALVALLQLCVWLALDAADTTHHQENQS